MAVIVADTVARVLCDDCPRTRVIVSERLLDVMVRVTVLDGCDQCAGSSVVLPAR